MKIRSAFVAVALAGAQLFTSVAEAAMTKPTPPVSQQSSDVEKIDLVCDFSGCYETWDRPPPRRPRPLPPEYYPPSVYDEPPVYRPRPRPPVYVEPGYRPRPRPPVYADPGYRPPGRGWERHVDWCLNRYRSYNPRTNQFLSSSGYYKVCQSPFY
ncbi:BA14K family protein [Rhizobium rosettiformans]|uniref:Lectin-like protein BA14k n=1 Tax=Rhizobium rosettiformans TaxID=1368430 RepID=A0ABX7ESW9_9HYPH|nr:BA14K family protein [Rhizobium rosettiformans]QRF51358.1 BA14K family protein [Rhizobium rosettiformans]